MSAAFDLLDEHARDLLRAGRSATFREPMLATLHDDPFSDPGWLYEVKLDGVRAIVVRDGDVVSLASRNDRPMDAAYPEIVEAFGGTRERRYVVDGEIVAFEGGRTSFSRLQPRIGIEDPERARRTGIAVRIYLFDILHLDGHDTTDLALRDRKTLLEGAFEYEDPIRYSSHRDADGQAFFDEACRRGWEGLIAKRAGARYRSGRSRDWLKLKCVRRQELVVVGFTEPRGSRAGLGALLLGYHGGGRLRYAGKVGTGFDDRTLRELRERLEGLERGTAPVDDQIDEPGLRWVDPELVAEVGFTEWTRDGRLRHPRFLGLREDRDPDDIVRLESS